jgi:16S rRNA (cytosine1402-N4)-methyltransferase
MSYHKPVMLEECIEGLAIKPEGVYVDLTFGGGGHSRAILDKLTTGRLYGFDQDEDAKANAEQFDKRNFIFVQANFRYLKRYLKLHGESQVDGVLGDLGISSHQIDVPERGFSTRFNAELDMRMDQNSSLTAKKVVNEYKPEELHKIFGIYGEVKNAKTLANAIASERINKPVETVDDLKNILKKFTKRGQENKYYAQVFQALRIEVNDEMKALEEALEQSGEVLKAGGRLVIMSYHSLEDRLVKNYMAKGNMHGETIQDFYGNLIRNIEPVTRKPVTASERELQENNRARSAKLRIAQKLESWSS